MVNPLPFTAYIHHHNSVTGAQWTFLVSSYRQKVLHRVLNRADNTFYNGWVRQYLKEEPGCRAMCRGGDDQAGQCRLQCLISSNWSRWSKTKEKVETCELTVCSQAAQKTKKNCNLAFCEKCELTESFSSPSLHLSFCLGSHGWLLSYSETYCSVARLKHVSLTHKYPNTTGNLISTPDNGVSQSSVTS